MEGVGGHGRGRGRGHHHATSEAPAFGMGRGRGRGSLPPNSHSSLVQQSTNPHSPLGQQSPNALSLLGQQYLEDEINPSMFSPLLGVTMMPDPIGNLPVSEADLQALMNDMYHPDPLLEAPTQEAEQSFEFRTMERAQGQGRGRGRARGHNGTNVRLGRGRGRGSTRGRGSGRGRPNSQLGQQARPSNPPRVTPTPSNRQEEGEMQNHLEANPPREARATERGRGRGRGRGHGHGHGRGRGRGRRRRIPSPPLNPSSEGDEDYEPPLYAEEDEVIGGPLNVIPDDYDPPVDSDVDDGNYEPPVNLDGENYEPPEHQEDELNDPPGIREQPNLPEAVNPPPDQMNQPPNQNNPVPKAPPTPPLFTKQEGHRSQKVITGPDPGPLVVRKHCLKKFIRHKKYTDYLVDAGFYSICRLGYICADKYLITALVERWRPETHTFHLPVGEMMITLQDVAVLLGLPIDGEPVVPKVPKKKSRSPDKWHNMIRKYLGREVDRETFRAGSGTAISISWLKKHFQRLPNKNRDETDEEYEYKTQCYVRAVILMTLGSILFTDLSGDAISIHYLPLIKDLSRVGRYSWGSATLAYLNRELCRACKEGTKQMGGSVILLQLWAWERFLFGRPEMRSGIPKPTLGGYNYRPEFRRPYGYKWSGYHDWTNNPARVLQYYRDELDYLREYQVNWEPYSEEDLALLPPICTASEHLWNYSGPLIHFWMVEPHNTRRVQRQFGRYQNFPPTPCDLDEFSCKNKNPGGSSGWKNMHEMYLGQWDDREYSVFEEERPYDVTTYEKYMKWFANNSRLYLQPLRSNIRQEPGPLRDLLYQVRASITHETAGKVKELGAECKKNIDEGAEGELKEFSLKMLHGLKDVLTTINEFVPGDPIFRPLYEAQNQEPQAGQGGGGGGGAGSGGGDGGGGGGTGGGRGGGSARPGKRPRVRGG